MFDTHCHLTFEEFRGRVDQVLLDAAAVGVHGAITVATTSTDVLAARALAEAHDNLWFTAGIHPLHADEPVNWNDLATAASHPKCVAWGELGLDHHYANPPRDVQVKVLTEQLAFIQSHQREKSQSVKPVVVHCRDAIDDLLAIFRATALDPSRFVFHCFNSGPEDARKVLDFGSWISFTGIVTFRNAPEVADAAKIVPADRIMVETDSPFLSPEPVRKTRPNQPKHVIHIARCIAGVRGVDPFDFERQLDLNAQRFFGIHFLTECST